MSTACRLKLRRCCPRVNWRCRGFESIQHMRGKFDQGAQRAAQPLLARPILAERCHEGTSIPEHMKSLAAECSAGGCGLLVDAADIGRHKRLRISQHEGLNAQECKPSELASLHWTKSTTVSLHGPSEREAQRCHCCIVCRQCWSTCRIMRLTQFLALRRTSPMGTSRKPTRLRQPVS